MANQTPQELELPPVLQSDYIDRIPLLRSKTFDLEVEELLQARSFMERDGPSVLLSHDIASYYFRNRTFDHETMLPIMQIDLPCRQER
jgi:hypothetical protein